MNDRIPPPITLAEFGERVRCMASMPFWRLSQGSGGRDEVRNKEVGGHENSWHRWERGGLASDMYYEFDFDWSFKYKGEDVGPMEVLRMIAQQLGMDFVDYSGHVHVEPADE